MDRDFAALKPNEVWLSDAPMESLFASLKKELVHHEDYATVEAPKASEFEYTEVFYNRIGRYSALGYVAPAEFECSKNS
jgi:putative transposase